MDEAFLSISAYLQRMQPLPGVITDEAAGIRSQLLECRIDSPLELEVGRSGAGALELACVPPLYYVETGLMPVFHRLRFTLVCTGGQGDE